MLNKSQTKKLTQLLDSVGDMALKRRARRLVEELDLLEKDRVIDLGCGDGFFLHLISQISPKLKLQGVDNDPWVLERAKQRINDASKFNLKQVDLQKITLKDNLFDKAYMTEVLEHVPSDIKALKNINRILKTGGVLVLTVPNYNFPFFWDPINWTLQNLFGVHIKTGFWAGIWKQHLRLYKTEELVELLNRTGFKVEVEEELTSWCLPFNHYLVNIVARLLYDYQVLPKQVYDSLDKFKKTSRPWYIEFAFWFTNTFDRLNDLFPTRGGLNILIKARKVTSLKQNL